MDVLKSATSEQHRQAERRQLQRKMVAGEVSREIFGRWLGQMMLLHRALWEAIVANRARERVLGDVVQDEGLHVVRLQRDLAALELASQVVAPLATTSRAVAGIRETAERDPIALLGYNYVLEGSMNGNRFIARAMAPTVGAGATSYLDPYGAEQPAVWQAYRGRMNGVVSDAPSAERIVAAARAMFDWVSALSDELIAAT